MLPMKTSSKRVRRTNAQLHMDQLKEAVEYFSTQPDEVFDTAIDDKTFELMMFLVLGFAPSKEALNASVPAR